MLPCQYHRLWRITHDLIGFRQGEVFGVYSISQLQVVHAPVLPAAIPYFKQADFSGKGKTTRPRMVSDYGTFEKHSMYLERCDYLLWRNDKLYLKAPEGVVVIDRQKGLRAIPVKNPNICDNLVGQRCLYEGEYGDPTLAKRHQFRYKSAYDQRIDEAEFLEAFAKGGDTDFSLFTGSADFEDLDEEDEEPDEVPVYKTYDYDAIPAAIKSKLHQHLDQLTNNKTYDWLARVLIYMAWCHANDYVTYTRLGEMVLDPEYALAPEDAEHIFDAAMLYEAHHMDQLQHLLYLSPITNTYYEVLANEN